MWFQTDVSENSSCLMCGHLHEDGVHFLFQCPVYHKLRESVSQPNRSYERNILAFGNQQNINNKPVHLSYSCFGYQKEKERKKLS